MLAKWAMTLDGKIAARTGSSRWISSVESRAIVHQLRGRMDGILVGAGTVQADDPLLTARPPGVRPLTRIILDSRARLSVDSQLVRTIAEGPVLLMTSEKAPAEKLKTLESAGVKIWKGSQNAAGQLKWDEILLELGRRGMTNLLVEGGSQILTSLWESNEIDEYHVFIAPKIVGGSQAFTPIAGEGLANIPQAADLCDVVIRETGGDIYLQGRKKNSAT
ncbi:MAG: RibD family protein [Planctomycetaceae bacterium]